jgi:hypothetical protein
MGEIKNFGSQKVAADAFLQEIKFKSFENNRKPPEQRKLCKTLVKVFKVSWFIEKQQPCYWPVDEQSDANQTLHV